MKLWEEELKPIRNKDGIENDFDSDLSKEEDLNGWNYHKDK